MQRLSETDPDVWRTVGKRRGAELNSAPSSSRVQGTGVSEDETEQVSGVREGVHGGALPVGLESMERAELVLLRRERELWERERGSCG